MGVAQMPGEISQARLVAEGVAAWEERRPWRPLEGAPQGTGAGAVSSGGSDPQDGDALLILEAGRMQNANQSLP